MSAWQDQVCSVGDIETFVILVRPFTDHRGEDYQFECGIFLRDDREIWIHFSDMIAIATFTDEMRPERICFPREARERLSAELACARRRVRGELQ
jgi:hypothetical protein